jgi:hypothetical protein
VYIELIAVKAFRKFIRIYSLLKSERLSANKELTFDKALIRPITSYDCPAREFAADSHLLKELSLQNIFLRTISNLPRRTGVENSVRLRLYNKTMQEAVISHTK